MGVSLLILIIIVVAIVFSTRKNNGNTSQEPEISNKEIPFLSDEEESILYIKCTKLYEKAVSLYKEGKDDLAISVLEESTNTYSAFAAPYEMLIDIYVEKKEFFSAKKIIQRGIKSFVDYNNKCVYKYIQNNPQEKIKILHCLKDGISPKDSSGKILIPLYPLAKWELIRFEVNELENSYYNELKEHNKRVGELLSKVAELNNRGINFEKSGSIDQAIKCYEENILLEYPATHSYNRLMILYRKKKDYKNEIRVIEKAIDVFTNENIRRANLAIENNPELADEILYALESNEPLLGEDYRKIFVQYDIMNYITRLEKAKLLYQKSEIKNKK